MAKGKGLTGGTDLQPNAGDVNSTGFGIPSYKAKEFGEVKFVGGSDGKSPFDEKKNPTNEQVIRDWA